MLQRDNTARFDWRVENIYKYDSLVEPVGHTEHRELGVQPTPLEKDPFVTAGPVEQTSGSSVSTTDNTDTRRESGAQSTPLGETAGTNGPDAQPRDVSTHQGDNPTRFAWRVDLRNKAYRYEKLVEPGGPAEQAGGSDTPPRTTFTPKVG